MNFLNEIYCWGQAIEIDMQCYKYKSMAFLNVKNIY